MDPKIIEVQRVGGGPHGAGVRSRRMAEERSGEQKDRGISYQKWVYENLCKWRLVAVGGKRRKNGKKCFFFREERRST